MRTCLIGGSGFIGRYLVEELLASGREVLVLGRKPSAPPNFNNKAEYVQCDVEDRALLRKHLERSDEVVDLAYSTVPKTSFLDPIFDLQSNLPSSIGLLEEASKMPHLKKVLFVSSGGTVYGQVDSLPISEDVPTSPVSPYGITKLTIERYMLMYHRLHGLPAVIVRPSNAYGAGQLPFTGQGFIATAMGAIYKKEPVTIFGEKGTIRDYIHVKDLVHGIQLALTNGEHGGVYNIGSGVGRNNKDVLDVIERRVAHDGYTINLKIAPERGFDVSSNVLNFGKLLSSTGWLPKVGFDDGVAEMWEDIKHRMKHN